MPLFHTHIVVDSRPRQHRWSARSSPSPKRRTKDAIWWAVARICGGEIVVASPEYERTRHEALDRLAGLIAGELDAGRRVLVGFDFPFGLSGGCRRTSDRHGVGPRALGLARGKNRGRGRTTPTIATMSRRRSTRNIEGRRPMLGPPGQWSYPTIPPKKSSTHMPGIPPARAPHRGPSRKGRQDRLAARLCRLRRLADAAGPARAQAPCDGPAPRGPRRDLALRDRLASARRAGGDRRGLPLASQGRGSRAPGRRKRFSTAPRCV